MTTVKLKLRDLLSRALGGTTMHVPATVDLDDMMEFADFVNISEEIEQNIDDLLTAQRMIGIIWQIEDVKGRRPELSDQQCWDVLQTMQREHDCGLGISWDTIESTAESLFGGGNCHRVSRCELALSGYGSDSDSETCLIDFLTDAMFWCHGKSRDFPEALRIAEDHFSFETDGDQS